MKYILIYQICSMLTSQCVTDTLNQQIFDSWSECVIGGAEKTIVIAKKDKKVFDEHKMFVKYWCSENKSYKTSISS